MASYNNVNDLMKAIQKKVQESLKTDVAKDIIKVEQKHIQSDVYDVYTPDPTNPNSYRRTYKLISDASFQVDEITDGISIWDTRHDEETGKYIPYTLETGRGYEYNFAYNGVSRPFVENTIDEILREKLHVKSLKKSLESKGIQVE